MEKKNFDAYYNTFSGTFALDCEGKGVGRARLNQTRSNGARYFFKVR